MDNQDTHAYTHPLEGKSIVVTRARAQAQGLALGLESLGATIIEFPTIEVRLSKPTIDFYVDAFDWIVFTSANSVRGLRVALEQYGQSFCLPNPNVCAVGPATMRTLQGEGIEVDLVPEVYNADAVFEAIKLHTGGELFNNRFLLPQGNIARNVLSQKLQDEGAEVTEVVVYETRIPEFSSVEVGDLVAAAPDMVTFTSGSTARNFCKMEAHHALASVDYASIGPFTTEVAQKCGLDVAVESEQHDIPGLIRAILSFYTESTDNSNEDT